jgi:hypothetical protein
MLSFASRCSNIQKAWRSLRLWLTFLPVEATEYLRRIVPSSGEEHG